MELGTASRVISAHVEGGGSVSNASALSQQERIFCDAFVGNGGNATEAVIAAGYSINGADVQACRLLSRHRVAARIKAQCEVFAHTQLPAAIRALVTICGNEALLPKDRIKAANSLIELAGVTAPKGGISVNVAVVNGQQAQQLIGEVWTAKQSRLSDIPPAMSDNMKQLEANAERLIGEENSDHGGGDHEQGPGAGTCPVPVQSSAPNPETDDLGPGAKFRRVFDGDDAE